MPSQSERRPEQQRREKQPRVRKKKSERRREQAAAALLDGAAVARRVAHSLSSECSARGAQESVTRSPGFAGKLGSPAPRR